MPPVLDVVVPVHNEEGDLEPCLRRLHAHLTEHLPYAFRITVAENASTLAEDASSYTWVAAAAGANNAAGYQLATELPVMPVGGFNGSDPSPTLAQFQAYVADGQIHWFIGGGMGMGSDGSSSSATEIAAWVADTFTAQTVDGVTMYDLTQPAG
jgi:hypothetical protein